MNCGVQLCCNIKVPATLLSTQDPRAAGGEQARDQQLLTWPIKRAAAPEPRRHGGLSRVEVVCCRVEAAQQQRRVAGRSAHQAKPSAHR